jgi:hypothetical protein
MRGADAGADLGARPEWQWDVALSFAGAQRSYVEQVAEALTAQGVRCFYDADEQIELWGKYLAEELPAIYGEQAAAVVSVSGEYAARDWTRLERRAALDRAVRERREFVLPARFDDTTLPGLMTGMVAIDLRTRTPKQFASMIVSKLAALGITGLAPPADAGDPARTQNAESRRDGGEHRRSALDDVAVLLARVVKEQWSAAAVQRRLRQTEPIPVRWERSSKPVAGPVWAALRSQRFTPLPGLERVGPEQLDEGGLRDLHAIYGGLGSGRLMIVGAPGSGKTGAAVLLVLVSRF